MKKLLSILLVAVMISTTGITVIASDDININAESVSIEKDTVELCATEAKQFNFKRYYENGYEYAVVNAYDINGNLLWSYRTNNYSTAQLNQTEGIGAISTGYLLLEKDRIICLDKATGQIKWANTDFRGGDPCWCFDSDENLYIRGYFGGGLFKISKNGKTILQTVLNDYWWPSKIYFVGNGALAIECSKNGTKQMVLYVDPDTFVYSENNSGFFDVSSADWFSSAVNYVNSKGYMTGMTKFTFGPANTLSRAQFATILYRIAGSPLVAFKNKFPDVTGGTWYSDPVIWASNAGVVTGYQSGYFGPADNINREQLAVMMYRYAKYCGYDTSQTANINIYPDCEYMSSWAVDAMRWAVGTGIITGKNGGLYLDPGGNASRAECAVIIQRFMDYYG